MNEPVQPERRRAARARAAAGRAGRVLALAAPWVALAATMAFYTVVQVRGFTPGYNETDPDGYAWLAKRIARGQPTAVRDPDPFAFQSHVWVENDAGEITAKFAPGYPLLLAAAWRLGGDNALFVVSPVMGGLTLLAVFALTAAWTGSRGLAAAAVAAMAASSFYLYYCSYLLAHASSMAFVAWGMAGLWWWVRRPRAAPALLAGLALGFSVAVRHSNALFALPLAIGAGAVCAGALRRRERPPASLLVLLAAYALFPVWTGCWNLDHFGGFFTTGYALTDEQGAFAFSRFPRQAALLSAGLGGSLAFGLFPVGVAGAVVAGRAWERLARLTWLVPPFVLYACYYFSTEGGATYRFLFEILPALAAGTFLLLSRLDRAGRALAAAALLLAVAAHEPRLFRRPGRHPLNARAAYLGDVAAALETLARPDAALFLPPSCEYALGWRRDYEACALSAFDLGAARRALRPPGRSTPRRQPRRRKRLEAFYGAADARYLVQRRRARVDRFLREGRQVLYILRDADIPRERGVLDGIAVLTPLAERPIFGRTWNIVEAARAGANPPGGQENP